MKGGIKCFPNKGASQVALVTKSPPANARGPRDAGSVLGREDSLRKEMEAYPSSPAWKIP